LSPRLFVERFLTPLADGDPEPVATYDEERSLNLTADGRPLVEIAGGGTTGTITEVRAEASDRDDLEDARSAALGTFTKVRAEAPDRIPELATQTRVRREHGDRLEAEAVEAAGRGSRAVSRLGTRTGVRGEAADFTFELEPGEEAPVTAPARILSSG
jgi:hypothetical protein